MNIDKTLLETDDKSPFYYFVAILLLISLGASLVLASTRLGFIEHVPGCGVGSGCDAVTNGPWGKIPGLRWPVSFVGVAWFVSMFFVWIRSGSKIPTIIWLIRLGGVASIGFFIVMVGIGHFCKWCALAHVCNLLFWVIAEANIYGRAKQHPAPGCRHYTPFLLVLVFASAILGAVQFASDSFQEQRDIKASDENIGKVIQGTSDTSTLELLEATHRIGPEDALVKVVIFTDYQCPDCKRIEGELAAVVAGRDDVSVSVKHFPLCFDCNDNIGQFKPHPNACWAARAAEAASILGGEEGWERMHGWLFEQGGRFTDESFPASITSLGFNYNDFIAVMRGSETLRRVKAETNDGAALGIYFTPMVFINGVEYLWYYGRGESLDSLINKVAMNVRAGGGGGATPPDASEKLVEDWRRGRVLNTPGHGNLAWTGGGPIEFVVWGDYQAPLSADIDREIKKLLLEDNSQITYAFRHFPVDEACNAGISNLPTKYDGSCYLSKLVESVGVLAGNEQRWVMHDWILAQKKPVHLHSATEYAAALSGVDAEIIQDVVGGIDVDSRMRLDILSKNGVWRRGIPVITIDGRHVPRWRTDDVAASELFHRIINVVGLEGAEEVKR